MKNIHLIPTDNEQHSIVRKNTGLLLIQTPRKEYSGTKLNLYITSDEQPKHNDYYTIDGKKIYYCNTLNPTRNNHYKKIILTTDQDLINNGVQAIDDEFLEWFVNNPGCEEVKVDRDEFYSKKSFIVGKDAITYTYKIIIPKKELTEEEFCHYSGLPSPSAYIEQPKQELLPDFKITKNIFDFVTDLSDTKKEEPKTNLEKHLESLHDSQFIKRSAVVTQQETLEDVIYKIFKSKEYSNLESNPNAFGFMLAGAQEGTKWQTKTMYSEEEVLELLLNRPGPYLSDEEIKEWFEQNKKK